MRKHLVWIVALIVGLLSSCHIDREAAARAEQALQEVGERYHAEKSICDSLLDVATSYYLPDLAKGDTTLSSFTSTAQQAECMLYEGIRHHDRAQRLKPDMEAYAAEMTKAYRLFLEVEQNEELLAEPYLKGVINNRLAIISMQNSNRRQAFNFFRKELEYVLLTGDTADIAISYTHLAYSFFTLDNGDSALYYSDRALYFAPHLDNRALASLYANTAYYQQHFGIKKERSDSLISQIPFEKCTRYDSCRIFIILVDYYLGKGAFDKADNLLKWTIAHSDGKPEVLTMAYLRRTDLFEKLGMPDSALAMSKALSVQRKLFRQSQMGTENAEAKGEYIRSVQQHYYRLILVVITLTALIALIFFIRLWLRRIHRTRQLERRITSINAKMEQYYSDFTLLQADMNQHLTESKDREDELKRQLKESPNYNQSLHAQIDYMLRRYILFDNSVSWPSSLFDELLAIYRESSPARRHLLEELDKVLLVPRYKAICMLICEHKHDPKKLWYYAGCANEAAFRATKSQIKRKLEAAPSSPEIKNLLIHFSQDRGPAPRQLPDVKDEGN